MKNKATKQGNVKVSPISGVAPPVDRQFGQPNGNKRHNGAWKKQDTIRYKWEKILEMDDSELHEVIKDPKCGRVEKMTAEVLLDMEMRSIEKIAVLEKLATQIYGQPKQQIDHTVAEPKPLIDLTKRKKNGDNKPA